MPAGGIRLLLVDDSKSVRAILRRFFGATPDIEVVGEAPDGAQAVDAVLALHPDVVLMDLQMPVMDGHQAIAAVMRARPTPIIVLSSRARRREMASGFEALRLGAVDVLPKPEDTESWRELAASLPATVRAVAGPRQAPAAVPCLPLPAQPLRWVAIGASTGGPPALRALLRAVPPASALVFLVVQHIAPGFELGLVDWLDKEVPGLRVRLAREHEAPRPATVHLAPAGAHLRLGSSGELVLDHTTPPRRGHRPSADELLLSLAAQVPGQSAGILLSGMGADGVEGLLALRRAGGFTLVQDESSSAVFGMPRVALERGAAEVALPPHELGAALARGPWSESR
jgi:two-component system chemotaxis response regulator CheB